MPGKTEFEKEGNAPFILEQYNTIRTYEFTAMSGVLAVNVPGYLFLFRAHPNNAGIVRIGGSANQWFPLDAGVGISLPVENLNLVYAVVPAGNRLNVLVLDETAEV